jgi:hypothetical protein
MGASRSRVASRAESDTSSPDSRGCGTEVSVLIAAPQSRCTQVPPLGPCNGSFPLTADTSRLAATPRPVNAQARRQPMGSAPSRFLEHPQWPRRRASHILGDIARRRGHDADLGALKRSSSLPAAAASHPVAWPRLPGIELMI